MTEEEKRATWVRELRDAIAVRAAAEEREAVLRAKRRCSFLNASELHSFICASAHEANRFVVDCSPWFASEFDSIAGIGMEFDSDGARDLRALGVRVVLRAVDGFDGGELVSMALAPTSATRSPWMTARWKA